MPIENEKIMSFRCSVELATAVDLEAKRRGINKTDIIKQILSQTLLGTEGKESDIEAFRKEFKAVVVALNSKIKQLESRLESIETVENIAQEIKQPSPFETSKIFKQNFDPSKF